jgi:hypothetical protein
MLIARDDAFVGLSSYSSMASKAASRQIAIISAPENPPLTLSDASKENCNEPDRKMEC